ncbi:MAG TPA: hypothetical protein VFB60_13025 [Ktedonobacteraceae bacterium]|nr:hypothetical protein [Ktedonobacteraceae bacterium]
MPVLVHLTPEKNVKRILHAGIHKGRGVYCLPVLQSYYVVSQVVGWRYLPGARQRAWCTCPVCISPGEINSRRKRAQHMLRMMKRKRLDG